MSTNKITICGLFLTQLKSINQLLIDGWLASKDESGIQCYVLQLCVVSRSLGSAVQAGRPRRSSRRSFTASYELGEKVASDICTHILLVSSSQQDARETEILVPGYQLLPTTKLCDERGLRFGQTISYFSEDRYLEFVCMCL